MNSLLDTIRFLTIIPAGRPAHPGMNVKPELFPVIGLMIGLILMPASAVLFRLLPPLVAGTCAIISLIALTGGLHLDGLADTADGFFSSRTREEILHIMRDSRTGAMGVTAVVCVVTLKVAAASSLAPEIRARSLLLMPIAGRCAMAALMGFMPPSKPDGLAAALRPGNQKRLLIWALLFPMVIGGLSLGLQGVIIISVCLLAIAPLSLLMWRKIGGITGDTLGAACEVVEAVFLVAAAAGAAQNSYFGDPFRW